MVVADFIAIIQLNKQQIEIIIIFDFSYSNVIIPENIFKIKKNNPRFDRIKMNLCFFFIL